MKTLVMNGNPDPAGQEFEGYLDDFIRGTQPKATK